MSYIGKWSFHSIGQMDENGAMTYMTAEEYLNSPMMYVDETDEEAVADEIKERKQLVGSLVEICDDGKLYILMPMPEGASEEEIKEAVRVGAINMRNGMLYERALAWEERAGKLWYDTSISGEAFGEETDTWTNAVDENGYFTFMTMRYEKED